MVIDLGLTLKFFCVFYTKLDNFGHSWRNHFPQKNQMLETRKVTIGYESCFVGLQP
jgi:hypothetical protein